VLEGDLMSRKARPPLKSEGEKTLAGVRSYLLRCRAKPLKGEAEAGASPLLRPEAWPFGTLY